MDMHVARGGNGFGPNALAFSEIEAYQRLMKISFDAEEVELIRVLDALYLSHVAQRTRPHG